MSKNISNERMAAFTDKIVAQVRELLNERQDDILKAWHENIEEAQDNEKDTLPPLSLSIGSKVDIEKSTITTKLGFTANYQSSLSSPLPDPNQPELPGVGGEVTMTISSVGRTVSFTADQLEKAAMPQEEECAV